MFERSFCGYKQAFTPNASYIKDRAIHFQSRMTCVSYNLKAGQRKAIIAIKGRLWWTHNVISSIDNVRWNILKQVVLDPKWHRRGKQSLQKCAGRAIASPLSDVGSNS